MLEKIYTIPVNEAFDACRDDATCGCPICVLRKRLEKDELEIILGAAMMDPDIRIKTNEQGFCGRHFDMMLERNNRLGLALILESHLAEVRKMDSIPAEILTLAQEVTDTNAVFFDSANEFAGCIAGLHEVLRRQGLFRGIWCLNPDEKMSPGQAEEIDRVYKMYPHLHDDAFIAEHLAEWLAD